MKKTLLTFLSVCIALGAMAQGKAGHKVVQTSVKPAEVVVNKDRIEHPFKGSMDGQRVDGYRGIWFTIGQARSDYGDKYSGGLGTYTMKHIPMAVYSKEADKTFFVYGGAPDARENYLLSFLTLAMIHPTCLHLCTKLLSKARKGDAIHPEKSALFTIY